MTPQELKNSILQFAIHGKLVEQRPEEGTADELYRQIQVEKQKLIKAGKMKKGKPLPQMTDNDIPFDIPESWKWVRLSELGAIVGGGTPKTENAEYWDDAGVPWLTPADMKFIIGKYAKQGKRNISIIGLEKSSAQLMPKGTVLYSSRAPIGYIAIAANDISTNQGFKSLVPAVIELNEFIYYCLMARTSDIVSRASGTTFKEISGTDFGLTIVPLPPLAEQKRIVAKIEELLPYIDRYEKAWSELEDLNKRFPTDMQKSILQMAIQGKLVEQHSEEGTAEELYQQIQTEKQKLIKAGTIKKEKPMPEIAEDEKPFDIPESWKWVRFGEVISLLSGTDFKPEDYNDAHKGVPYITGASSLSLDGVLINRWTETPRVIANRGDVLLVCKGSGYGKTVICNVEEAHIARQIMAIKHFENLCMKYIKSFLEANLKIIKSNGQGVIPGIDRGSVLNMAFPLPSLVEQKRIVAKLEEILPLCEKLK